MTGNMSCFCSYRWANRAAIGPSEMPICRTYDEAEEQYNYVHTRRMTRLEEKAQRLEDYEDMEAERRLKEAESEYIEKADAEKAEEAEREVR